MSDKQRSIILFGTLTFLASAMVATWLYVIAHFVAKFW